MKSDWTEQKNKAGKRHKNYAATIKLKNITIDTNQRSSDLSSADMFKYLKIIL